MPSKKLRPEYTFDRDRIEQLKKIAPEAFADEKINWEVLQEVLGEYLEPETLEIEHFGLSWPGKREARRLASIPSKGTLVPSNDEGINEDKTHNIFIEGDNLEVLKLLQKCYAGRIKMIYLDPPYNTGNDFIYNDDFIESLDKYLELTGQADEQGNLLITNPQSSGRYHSAWLSMFYPRLRLACQLLREDGLIFVSIDDNEVHNLRELMNEVFGEENFLAEIVRVALKGGTGPTNTMRRTHDYVLVYARDRNCCELGGVTTEALPLDQEDKLGRYRKGRELNKWGAGSRRQDSPSMWFPIPGPDGTEVYPIRNDGTEGRWRWGKRKLLQAVQEGNVIFEERVDGTFIVYEKVRSIEPIKKSYSTIISDNCTNAEGTEDLKRLFDDKCPIDYPKPVNLIKRLCSIANLEEDDIVMDFFAGSCTTAHSVLETIIEDSVNINFIMVQLPEPTPDTSVARVMGYVNIAELGKERIRRVINNMNPKTHKTKLGFKVFRLDRSNFEAWNDYHGEDIKQLEMLFNNAETPLVDNWTRESLLIEVMLIQGFPLDSMVNQQSEFKKNIIQLIESTTSVHRLFVCFDSKVEDDTVKGLKINPDDIFVCLDSALTDQSKMRLSNICTLATI